ncbi:SsrA-binding protein SmpB [Candidatus Gracilibacteria bacterium]|nr:SsrA-binding protein SmpB [Candidatus Gracilibacteria bacterium]
MNNQTSITKNKKAYFDYEVLDNWEAGIVLTGAETKSVRQKHVNLKGSYIVCISGELYVKGMHISALASLPNRESIATERERKILLRKKTILYLMNKIKEGGNTLLPLELYFKGSLIKMRVGLAKGRKKYQKKQVLKERTLTKEAQKAMKKYF